jgi:hypothetical protein
MMPFMPRRWDCTALLTGRFSNALVVKVEWY